MNYKEHHRERIKAWKQAHRARWGPHHARHERKERFRYYKHFPHNRLWVRLSMGFGCVLLIAMTLPILMVSSMFALRHMIWDGALQFEPRAFGGIIFLLTIITIFSGFVGLMAGALVSRRLGRQVNHLVKASQSINMSSLHLRVEEKGVDELRELASSFNRMIAELERGHQTRRNLLADVSHELLTPLTVLEGNLRAMLDGVYEMNAEEISYLYDETHHLIGLVKELRELTKAEANQLQLAFVETSVNESVIEVHSLFEPLAQGQSVRLETRMGVDLPLVLADSQRVRQMLSNLLANALRHTPADGTIILRTAREADFVSISIQDSGDGISADELDQIFDRFYRTDGTRRRDAGGSGLGLAIVRALVEAHGGIISAESPGPQQGSTFTIKLPALIAEQTI
ncbi:MAG: sensor histidine kinase [Candidatus Promineifilaceae bacterium]